MGTTRPVPERVIPPLRVPAHAAVHAIIGFFYFAVVALAALLFSLFVEKLESLHLDPIIVIGLKVGEYTVFAFDLIMFGVFIMKTFLRTIKLL